MDGTNPSPLMDATERLLRHAGARPGAVVLVLGAPAALPRGNVEVRALSDESLDLPGDMFDAVVVAAPLLAQRDHARTLAGMRRVLKPGGRVVALGDARALMTAFESAGLRDVRVGHEETDQLAVVVGRK